MRQKEIQIEMNYPFQKVYGTIYEPETVVGSLILVHDLHEHRQRYQRLIRYYYDLGIAVLSYDLRGSRTSLIHQKEGNLGSKEELLDDLEKMIKLLKKQYELLPLTVLGIGFGANLSLVLGKEKPELIDRLVLVSPVAKPRASTVKWLLLKAISLKWSNQYFKQLWPTHLNIKINPAQKYDKWEYLSLDEKVIQSYHLDPLCGRFLTNGSLETVIKLVNSSYQALSQKIPLYKKVLVIGGKEDPLTRQSLSLIQLKQLLMNWGFELEDVLIFSNYRHDVLYDFQENEVLLTSLTKFLLNH